MPILLKQSDGKGGDAAMTELHFHIRGEPPGTAPPLTTNQLSCFKYIFWRKAI